MDGMGGGTVAVAVRSKPDPVGPLNDDDRAAAAEVTTPPAKVRSPACPRGCAGRSGAGLRDAGCHDVSVTVLFRL